MRKIRHACRDFRSGVRNCVRWFPVIWRDCDWDWAYLATILETKLRFMSKSSAHWMSASGKRDGRDMLECAELLRRLREDNYIFNLPLGQSFLHGNPGRWGTLHADAMAKQDEQRLWKLMTKMRGWWD